MEVDGEDSEEIMSSTNLISRSKLSSSFRLERPRSSLILSDSIRFQSARFTGYEQISESESWTFSDESPLVSGGVDMRNKQKKSIAWEFISKVFSFRKSSDGIRR